MDTLTTSYLVLIILFIIGWWLAVKIQNFSIVDAMWALALPIPVGISCIAHQGSGLRDLILLSMASAWSLRLGSHLAIRISRHHPVEDARYKNLRDLWQHHTNRNFFYLFQLNALCVFLLSLPFYIASKDHSPIGLTECIGLAFFITGLIGEMTADRQLATFLKNKQGKVICEVGLWNYSRHPNYFFEVIIWLGIYLFCAASPMGFYAVHTPILMLILLTKVTGIPPAEKSSLKSKGLAYLQYQQTTSAFIPWFKKTPKT